MIIGFYRAEYEVVAYLRCYGSDRQADQKCSRRWTSRGGVRWMLLGPGRGRRDGGRGSLRGWVARGGSELSRLWGARKTGESETPPLQKTAGDAGMVEGFGGI